MTRQVTYIDTDGRHFLTEIPDGASDDMARFGIPIGPPLLDITVDGEAFVVRLHNELYARKIFTLNDCKRRIGDVQAAVQAASKVDAQVVMAAFLNYESQPDGGSK